MIHPSRKKPQGTPLPVPPVAAEILAREKTLEAAQFLMEEDALVNEEFPKEHSALLGAEEPIPLAPLCSHGGKRFQLQKRLGLGGMCEVYMAIDLARIAWGDDRPQVVIKTLLPALRTNQQAKLSLAHEFFTLRHATHPGVVRVFDLHQHDDDLYLSMEYLRGETVYAMLAAFPIGLGVRSALFTCQLLSTISYLHTHGIAHGDIKPSNLLLTHKRRLVLFDFNMALICPIPGAATASTALGLRESLALPSYSLLYASPERMESKTPSMPDDVFACCCSIYEMYTGQHPYQRQPSTQAQALGLTPKKPSLMPTALWKAVQAGLCFAPEARPSAHALCKAASKPNILGKIKGLLQNSV